MVAAVKEIFELNARKLSQIPISRHRVVSPFC